MTTDALTSANESEEPMRNEVEVTVGGQDNAIPFGSLGIDMESSDRDVLNAVRPAVLEMDGVDLNDESGEVAFVVRRSSNTNVIHVYPKPVAG